MSTDLAGAHAPVHDRGLLDDRRPRVGRAARAVRPAPDGQRLLVDGGVLDNLPVDLLTERDEGPVVAVNITMGGGTSGPRTGAPRPVRVPALGETLLRTMVIGSGGAVERPGRRARTS